MRYPWQVIKDIEADNSRLAKEAVILREAEAGNSQFFEGVRLALDPMITFGLKQIPEKKDDSGGGLDWESFTLALTGFTTRQVTGNTARDMIASLMQSATKEQWNDWYRRILIKDMRAGFGEKSVNKVVSKRWPEYSIPIFSCQLAHDAANHENKVAGKKRIEVKLDGVRVITIIYPDGRVDQFSRNGKELVNFEHIKNQLAENASTLTEPMVLDGEVMSTSFQDLMRSVHRKYDVDASDAVLYLFDAVPLTDFQNGICKIKQQERSSWLNTWHDSKLIKSMANVACLDHAVIDLDTEEGQRLFKMYNKSAVENGYEGIMLKSIDAPYESKRTASWLKLKPVIEVTLEVTDVEEGTGRNIGRLGALVCSGQDDGKQITVNVGSGFSDSDRDQFWNDRDLLIGQLVEIRADAITQNQDGSYSLRFPRFLKFRGFDPGEKI
jgi:DNA ligase 1